MLESLGLHRSVGTLLTYTPLAASLSVLPSHRVVHDAVLQSGTLSFIGHATMGDFAGSTKHVTGAIIGGRDFASVHGFVEASVASLMTGNDLRDADLRASMEVDRYPTMRFDLASATLDEAADATDSLSLILHGSLTVRGITQRVDLLSKVVRTGETMRVTGDFPLDLLAYRIGGLTKLMGLLRVERQLEVHVDLRFIDRHGAASTP